MARQRKVTVRGWPADQLWTLWQLLHEIRYPDVPANALFAVSATKDQLEATDAKCVERDWARLSAHPLWRRVSRDTFIKAVWDAFKVNQRRSKRDVGPRDDFKLLFTTLTAAIAYQAQKAGLVTVRRTVAAKEVRQSAISAIKNLRGKRARGVVLDNSDDDAFLWELLDRLEQQLAGVARKPREYAQRQANLCLRTFADNLLAQFGDTSETVLTRFAELVSIDLEAATIRRILRQARNRKIGLFLAAFEKAQKEGITPTFLTDQIKH